MRFQDKKEILLQVTKGIAHLHSINNIRRDVKPTNLLVYQPTEGVEPVLKVADFGISKFILPEARDMTNTNMVNPKGTRGWMAPEQYGSSRLGQEVNIFALGCIFGYTLSIPKENIHLEMTWMNAFTWLRKGGP